MEGAEAIRVVDLFAGCGGLTLGIEQAAVAAGLRVEVSLAIDFEAAATGVYKANFPYANVVTDSVEAYFEGALGSELTQAELVIRSRHPGIQLLVGGPPCQGHSSLNNKTRRNDPKNELYARMGRAAEVLVPDFILVENVPSVRLDTDQVVQTTAARLTEIGYEVETETIALHSLGVAQTRKRHVLLASRVEGVSPKTILEALKRREPDPRHDLRWAIGDLARMPEAGRAGYDIAPVANSENVRRMQYLLSHGLFDLPNERRPVCHQNAHSYKSMYGRLKWTEPAQTITSGFGSIGQGRYMHPELTRALTGHEAARIQGFPDYFSFSTVTRRSEVSVMIGNAVPPALTRSIVEILMPSLKQEMTESPAGKESRLLATKSLAFAS
jgi:DNA (cytosine-5)-methyltransferase 1